MTTLRDWGSAHDRAELDAHITRDDDSGEPEEAPARQYLAWGGESEGFEIVSARQIRKDIESAHYSGWRSWDSFALLDGGAEGGPPVLRPVRIEADGERDVDDDDYVHQEYAIIAIGARGALPGTGFADEVIETFATRIDGRA